MRRLVQRAVGYRATVKSGAVTFEDGEPLWPERFDDKRIEQKVGMSGYPPDLASLVKGVTDVNDPGGRKLYFLRRVPRDPFFADPNVRAEDTWGKRSYASPPDDPREGDDVFDAINNQVAFSAP